MKIADELELSIDFLVGKTNLELDKCALSRIEDTATLQKEEKAHVFKVLDTLLKDYKTQRAYSS